MMGWLWFLITLVPVIGILSGGTLAMADRYTYVPLVGLFVAIVWGCYDLGKRFRVAPWCLAILGSAITVVLMFQARIQLGYWANDVKLFGQAVRITSNNWLAHHLLGVALVEQDQYEQAAEHFLEALRLDSEDPVMLPNLAFVYAGLGRWAKAEYYYENALHYKPHDPDIHNNLGIALAKQGKIDQAVAQYKAALKVDPAYEKARYNMQVAKDRQSGTSAARSQEIRFEEALALARQGKLKEAIACFENFLGQWPEYAPAHYNLGVLLSRQGDIAAAKAEVKTALRLQPDMKEAKEALDSLSSGSK